MPIDQKPQESNISPAIQSAELPPHAYPPKIQEAIRQFEKKKLLAPKNSMVEKHIKMPLVTKMNLMLDHESFKAMSSQTSKRSERKFISFKSQQSLQTENKTDSKMTNKRDDQIAQQHFYQQIIDKDNVACLKTQDFQSNHFFKSYFSSRSQIQNYNCVNQADKIYLIHNNVLDFPQAQANVTKIEINAVTPPNLITSPQQKSQLLNNVNIISQNIQFPSTFEKSINQKLDSSLRQNQKIFLQKMFEVNNQQRQLSKPALDSKNSILNELSQIQDKTPQLQHSKDYFSYDKETDNSQNQFDTREEPEKIGLISNIKGSRRRILTSKIIGHPFVETEPQSQRIKVSIYQAQNTDEEQNPFHIKQQYDELNKLKFLNEINDKISGQNNFQFLSKDPLYFRNKVIQMLENGKNPNLNSQNYQILDQMRHSYFSKKELKP